MTGRYGSYAPIEDYAIIGDCRSAALISKRGDLDWLCWPRFDSSAVFWALLDSQKGGRFTLGPDRPPEMVRRRYVGATNVLETTFQVEGGVLRLVDFMPVAGERAKEREPWPEHQILRIAECTDGQVALRLDCRARPHFGRRSPQLQDRGAQGIHFADGGDHYVLQAEFPLEIDAQREAAAGGVTLQAGDRVRVSLTAAHHAPALIPPLGTLADRRLEQTLRWWQEWVTPLRYAGPYRDAVLRSALTLKLLTYAPTGAVVAAPTTSLPEWLGGKRNWDYRYCWLRDASMTLSVLIDLGFEVEGAAFLSWMLQATHVNWPEIRVLYDVYGGTRIPERTLPALAGYADSRPVRIGNGAEGQLQLDTYGEVVEAVYKYLCRGGRIGRLETKLLRVLGETVCRRWEEPDEGIWETRAGRRQHTYSKVMCWVALDRLLALAQGEHLQVPEAEFRRTRDRIRTVVEHRGWNERLNSYVSTFDGDGLDASLLLLSAYGFEAGDSPRMTATRERIGAELKVHGLLRRYHAEDGLPPGEGAFGICSFWSAQAAALAGDLDAARQEFDLLLTHANDVGLFAEEIDPDTGAALGNFPQAFTHVGLIGAALAISEQSGESVAGRVSQPLERRERVT